MQRRRNRNRKRSAFTLIEVLLVAGILALLAAVLAPRLFSQAEQARIKVAESQIGRSGSIAKALQSYQWDMGVLPESDEGLAMLFQNKSDDERYKGPYMEGTFEELKDPWGKPFQYRRPGEFNEDGYDLWSTGPDGKDDGGKSGSDDVKNWIER
jgi:general secretion pathway protein G